MKFYEIKNITNTSADLYIYGKICLEKEVDWWTGEESKTDVALMDFKEQLDNLGDISELNIYVNSPGGDVFVASTMISMLERLKSKNIKINAYVDGLAASAASFLIMVADNIYMYKNSTVMIHKPISYVYGNSIDLQKEIDILDKIENTTMMSMYIKKAKIPKEEIKELIANESWLGATEMTEKFNIELLDTNNAIAACVDKELFAKYKNIPEDLQAKLYKPAIVLTEKQQKEFENFIDEINNKTIIQNDNKDKEEMIKNKLKLINSSLFIIKNKEI